MSPFYFISHLYYIFLQLLLLIYHLKHLPYDDKLNINKPHHKIFSLEYVFYIQLEQYEI